MKSKTRCALIFALLFCLPNAVYAAEEILPRHVFYNGPLVYSDISYSETCYPQGQVMDVLPGNQCCPNLEALPVADEALEECEFPSGIVVCSDCGNALCEFGENQCNCPEDCTASFEATPEGSIAGCADHVDNDGDGYCDASTRNGYCSDGSHLGDEKCRTTSGSEIAVCIPVAETCNGFDDDCDGAIDNLSETRSCGLPVGECEAGEQTRVCLMGAWQAWGPCLGEIPPKAEVCNDGKDNDCDGKTDEGCLAVPPAVVPPAITNTNFLALLLAAIIFFAIAARLFIKKRKI